ncbi:MAG: hypothetical protein Q7U80_10045 [Thiobacillus sp.]|nr:hypothetical protein [Thiobacillus sp.]
MGDDGPAGLPRAGAPAVERREPVRDVEPVTASASGGIADA